MLQQELTSTKILLGAKEEELNRLRTESAITEHDLSSATSLLHLEGACTSTVAQITRASERYLKKALAQGKDLPHTSRIRRLADAVLVQVCSTLL